MTPPTGTTHAPDATADRVAADAGATTLDEILDDILDDILDHGVADRRVSPAVAAAVRACAEAAVEIGDRIATAPIEGGLDKIVGDSVDGDGQ